MVGEECRSLNICRVLSKMIMILWWHFRVCRVVIRMTMGEKVVILVAVDMFLLSRRFFLVIPIRFTNGFFDFVYKNNVRSAFIMKSEEVRSYKKEERRKNGKKRKHEANNILLWLTINLPVVLGIPSS
jgi:hypothetical protein